MRYLLFPGRHLVNTRFQEEYLLRVLRIPVSKLEFHHRRPDWDGVLQSLVLAVTSANRQNSRYNPVPFHVRAIGVDRLGRTIQAALGVPSRIVGVPHYPPTARFANHLLREIEEQTEGSLRLTPENAVVLCSTPAVIEMFEQLGFSVLPAELGESVESRPTTPMDLVAHLAELGPAWETDPRVRRELSAATFSLWTDLPEVPHRVARLYRDPLLTDQGDLTGTRDYATYTHGMSNPDIVALKYQDVRQAIVEGKIVDEGCADGALLAAIAGDFPDSDLIGIEITGELLALCRERQRRGDFGGSYVYFHQRNLLEEIFEPESIDTTLCNSTTHELWSYVDGKNALTAYLQRKFRQTRRGGRLIIRDVVGPDDPDEQVWLWCDLENGSNDDVLRQCTDPGELKQLLEGLSTAGRFRRFVQDFLAAERMRGRADLPPPIQFEEETFDGRNYFVLRLSNAAEFLSKMDYINNWQSEMHEEFAFFSYADWKRALAQVGFAIIETPADPLAGSRVYLNPWIMDHRYRGRVELLAKRGDGLVPIEFPPTNVVLVAEKRGGV